MRSEALEGRGFITCPRPLSLIQRTLPRNIEKLLHVRRGCGLGTRLAYAYVASTLVSTVYISYFVLSSCFQDELQTCHFHDAAAALPVHAVPFVPG